MNKHRSLISPLKDPFSRKLAIAAAVVIAIASMSLNLYYYHQEKSNLWESALQEGRSLTKLLAHNSRLGIFTNDKDELASQVDAVMSVFHCRLAAIYDWEGQRLLVRQGQVQENGETQEQLLNDLQGRLFAVSSAIAQSSQIMSGDEHILVEPVFSEAADNEEFLLFQELSPPLDVEAASQPIGYAVLVLDQYRLNNQAFSRLMANTAATLVIILVSIMVIMIAISTLTAPLKRLVREIHSGQPGLADQIDKEELFSGDFQELIDSIRRSYLTIDTLRQHLEEKVAERTSALSTSNRELTEQKLLLTESNKALELTVTELRTTQAQLVQSEKMAALGQLVAGLSHEINNALSFITGAMALFEETLSLDKDPAADDAITRRNAILLHNMNEGAERIAHLTADLKIFSHRGEHNFQPDDLTKGLKASIDITRYQYGKRVDFVEELDRDLPKVNCNLGQLNQVFMNLLVNAAQAISGPGTVTVRTGCEQGWVLVSIEDTGKGIPTDKLDEIFNPFYTSKEIGDGTGLGLSISYGIIERHGGTIRVESQPGRGSTFTVRLPTA